MQGFIKQANIDAVVRSYEQARNRQDSELCRLLRHVNPDCLKQFDNIDEEFDDTFTPATI